MQKSQQSLKLQKFSRLGALLASFIIFLPGLALADPPEPPGDTLPHDVIITELQTENTVGSEEFIELYNNTDSPLDFSDAPTLAWNIQYFSSTKVESPGFSWDTTTPRGTLNLTGQIAARGYYIFASTPSSGPYNPGSVVPDQSYAGSHLADDGGIQLVSVNSASGTGITIIHDHVGWLSNGTLPDSFYRKPTALGSLQRSLGEDGGYVDSSNTLNNFVGSATISPGEAWQPPADPDPTPPPDSTPPAGDPASDPDGDPDPSPTDSSPALPLQINELLPNPATPQTDTNDEYVELYNPNDDGVDLNGYTVKTGTNLSYSYTIQDGTIAGRGYFTLTSGNTNLSLANSGGRAQLLNPAGEIISETTAYDTAIEGQAWAYVNNVWQWTTTPTPGAENILTLPPADPTAKKTTVKTASSKTATKKPSTAKTASAKTTAAKKSTGSGASADTSISEDQTPPAIHPLVLAAGGLSALVYAGYEYHQDVINKFHQFRRNRAARRALRTGP